ncbi:MAG: radical SAM protein [Clostridiales bacterium]|nr:radical SAM protein [Clostridiales bacterium]
MADLLRWTRSVCPVCLKPVKAEVLRYGAGVYMKKTCPEHGDFSVPVWRDKVDLEKWRGYLPVLADDEAPDCPHACGVCGGHLQGVCCVLLEVTSRCDLRCAYCFADFEAGPDPELTDLKRAVEDILDADDKPLLQFSGGEPTMRDDLPELIAYSRGLGCKYIQLNSNGLRLSRDEEYVRALAEAGLSFVFMQFDGANDRVYQALRGAPLFDAKMNAIDMCDKYGIGVTLVPTIVRGVNDDQVGDIIRLGASLSPAVRGVHFQPVSYFGRYPVLPSEYDRYTLDELILAIREQAEVEDAGLLPSRCDHPLCGFHGSFLVSSGGLIPLSHADDGAVPTVTTAAQNREYIGRRWSREGGENGGDVGGGNGNDGGAEAGINGNDGENTEECCCDDDCVGEDCCCDGDGDCCDDDLESFDGFLRGVRKHGFTLTAMVFQDAMNLDVERLRRCSLRVYHEGKLKPFCVRYLTAMKP